MAQRTAGSASGSGGSPSSPWDAKHAPRAALRLFQSGDKLAAARVAVGPALAQGASQNRKLMIAELGRVTVTHTDRHYCKQCAQNSADAMGAPSLARDADPEDSETPKTARRIGPSGTNNASSHSVGDRHVPEVSTMLANTKRTCGKQFDVAKIVAN
jgi:hypothetical protein